MERNVKRVVLFLLFVLMTSQAAFAAPKKPVPAKPSPKPKADMADIWGYRRGPKAPGSPERRAAEAKNKTPEQYLAEAQELKAKSEAKKAETEAAVAEMEHG